MLHSVMQQFDVHSPQTTVAEALLFSARLRLARHLDNATVAAFVQEVRLTSRTIYVIECT